MEAYSGFAGLYDEFMEQTPYDEWCEFIVEKLKNRGITDGLVCDLGCGTGEMTRRLKNKGFDMIGIDLSDAMLNVAKEKETDDSILYLMQDMREFELYGTVKAIVSVCDCMNYITEPEELIQVFSLCNNYLDPKGFLIFDFNTVHKYKKIGDSTIAETRDDSAFVWNNFYDKATKLNQYDVTFFSKKSDGNYERFDETHLQRGYTLSEIKSCIEAAGMKFLEAVDADTHKKPSPFSERIFVVAMEEGK